MVHEVGDDTLSLGDVEVPRGPAEWGGEDHGTQEESPSAAAQSGERPRHERHKETTQETGYVFAN